MLGATMRRRRAAPLWAGAVVAGGVLLLASPFLPWVAASSPILGTASLAGVDGGRGVVAALGAGAAAVAAGLALFLDPGGRARRLIPRVGVLAGIVAGVVGWVAIRDAADPAVSLLVSRDEASVSHAPGIGAWMLVLGSVLIIAGSIGAGVGRGRRGRTKVIDAREEPA